MLKLLLFVLLLCPVYGKKFDLLEELKLENLNYIHIEGTIEQDMASEIISNIFEQDEDFYIYINSNGGDVESGLKIVKMMKYLQTENIKIKCIADKAMSMAFHIFQHCDERLVTQNSVLMQHEMSIHLEGNIKDTEQLYYKYLQWDNEINTFDSARIKMDKTQYLLELKNELWFTGDDIITHNIADRKVIIK
jgi:ATP-dependent Clp protease protease subunit